MNMFLLCLFWFGWCTMHSLLIDPSVIGMVKKYGLWLTPYYRLIYNAVSLTTLIPLVIFTYMVKGEVVFGWDGVLVPVRLVLLGAALLLFMGGAKKYDLQYFLGIRQLRTGEEHLLLNGTTEFTETGVFGITRHPWYLGSLLLLWSGPSSYPLPVFLAVSILSAYLVVGTMLEERKIVALHGEAYGRYRQQVSMLFPWKWIRRFFR